MLLRRGRFDLSLGASKYSFVVAFGSSCFSGISDPAVPCLGHGSHWLLRPRLSKNFLPRLSDEWTLKWSQKKDLYGKKHLISVGGKIEGWTNMVDEPKVNDRAKDAPEPVCFFSPPIELMEELLHTFFGKMDVDLRAADGKLAFKLVCRTEWPTLVSPTTRSTASCWRDLTYANQHGRPVEPFVQQQLCASHRRRDPHSDSEAEAEARPKAKTETKKRKPNASGKPKPKPKAKATEEPPPKKIKTNQDGNGDDDDEGDEEEDDVWDPLVAA